MAPGTSIQAKTVESRESAEKRPRERILETARDLFYRDGIRAVGVEMIAAEAGTNKMTLYRNFGSKEELIAEYLRGEVKAVEQHWDDVIRGWGRGQESWLMDYGVIHGDANQKDTWDRLMMRLNRRWKHPLGFDLDVTAAAFDTGGLNTQSVHDFVGPLYHRNFICIKGMPGDATPVIGRQTLNNEFGVRVYPVGANTTKARVFAQIAHSINQVKLFEEGKISTPFGPGFCHFPRSFWTDPEKRHFYTQLIAPKAQHKAINGEWRTVYQTTQGVADHAFDCFRYALAAFYWLGTDIDQLATYLTQEAGHAHA